MWGNCAFKSKAIPRPIYIHIKPKKKKIVPNRCKFCFNEIENIVLNLGNCKSKLLKK
jgi:hypothetical protein